ncbi:MAG: phosphatidylserine decarboxylase family protein [candidate division Zixibacteria bacterium]|nr:phosphatidylserine decarboxylase family protein [candidate division Zixibacteria bacterium]
MIVRDGWSFIFVALALSIAVLFGALRWDSLVLMIVASCLAVLTVIMAFFFRDPDRIIPDDHLAMLAPADGLVVAIEPIDHPHIDGPATRISIFLSVFDVHINRVPCGGTIDYVQYNPGKFMAAFADKASDLNERTEIGLTTPQGHKLVFTQIAGLIARRIVCRLSEGDSVAAGERFGMIRFGSRSDLIVPATWNLAVKMGDRVKGGTTVIGYLPDHVGNQPQPDNVTESDVEEL